MRDKILIKLLAECKSPMKRADIAKKMNLSESSIRNLIKNVNQNGLKKGFEVEMIKGKGYVLHILDKELFNLFMNEEQCQVVDVYNPEQRIEIMLFYILQADKYITINSLMDKLMLSRTTIMKELRRIDQELAKFNLKLATKPRCGMYVDGSEQDFRKAFSKYVLSSNFYLEPTKDYKQFLKGIEKEELRSALDESLRKFDFHINDVAFENIVAHLSILIFRVIQNNFISEKLFEATDVDEVYFQIANDISNLLEEKYNISLPNSERKFLAAHISAKAFTTTIDIQEKDKLIGEIGQILEQLDMEFLTNFQGDGELTEGLLLHMFPLLNRLYYNLQLENPIIEEIYTKYTNVFVVSYRFGELIEEKYSFSLSKDEIGYLALHFAAHLERMKKQSLEKLKRIVVICTTGGGSAHLLRLKLENIFTNAIIVTTSVKDMVNYCDELPDLFLSTIPMEEEYMGIPIIQIKQFLDEMEIRRIKEEVSIQYSQQKNSYKVARIQSFFSKKFFQKVKGREYLEIIKKQANEMVVEGVAKSDFTELVLEREGRFSTIYQNNIAGPHSMKLNALINTIGVTILEKPIEWQGRTVQIIFLINLKQGHLFLHKEISRLLLYLIDNDIAREKLINCSSFEQFMAELDRFI